jgi:hypothetical protein
MEMSNHEKTSNHYYLRRGGGYRYGVLLCISPETCRK